MEKRGSGQSKPMRPDRVGPFPLHIVPPRPSLDQIFERELDYIWNCLRRLGVADRDVEDLAHELLLRVHDALPQFDPSRPLRPWLFGFAYRLAAEYRRRSHRLELLEPDLDLSTASEVPSPEALLVDWQDRDVVLRALGRVPLERRAVLLLHDVEDHSIPEVARSLGIPLNTAYSRLRIGRAELAVALKRLTMQQRSSR